jgi:hypothetical protein
MEHDARVCLYRMGDESSNDEDCDDRSHSRSSKSTMHHFDESLLAQQASSRRRAVSKR